jgi:tRNA modification GTPase
LLVLDASRPLDEDDRRLLASSAQGERAVVINKCDLPAAWDRADVADESVQGAPRISLRTGEGVAQLKQRLTERLLGTDRLRDVPSVTNIRHIELLQRACAAVARGRAALKESGGELPEEFLLADLQEARAAMEEVTGRRTTEDLLQHIFGRFCIGK